jgi:hypothetical protein
MRIFQISIRLFDSIVLMHYSEGKAGSFDCSNQQQTKTRFYQLTELFQFIARYELSSTQIRCKGSNWV